MMPGGGERGHNSRSVGNFVSEKKKGNVGKDMLGRYFLGKERELRGLDGAEVKS